MLNTASTAKTVAEAIREVRTARLLSLREFAAELDVSHNSIALWETGEVEPTGDRIAAWIRDPREWVRLLGVRVFSIKFGPMLANVAAGDTPPSAG